MTDYRPEDLMGNRFNHAGLRLACLPSRLDDIADPHQSRRIGGKFPSFTKTRAELVGSAC